MAAQATALSPSYGKLMKRHIARFLSKKVVDRPPHLDLKFTTDPHTMFFRTRAK